MVTYRAHLCIVHENDKQGITLDASTFLEDEFIRRDRDGVYRNCVLKDEDIVYVDFTFDGDADDAIVIAQDLTDYLLGGDSSEEEIYDAYDSIEVLS